MPNFQNSLQYVYTIDLLLVATAKFHQVQFIQYKLTGNTNSGSTNNPPHGIQYSQYS